MKTVATLIALFLILVLSADLFAQRELSGKVLTNQDKLVAGVIVKLKNNREGQVYLHNNRLEILGKSFYLSEYQHCPLLPACPFLKLKAISLHVNLLRTH